MPYTNIDAEITDAQRTAAITSIETNLAFLVSLTPEAPDTPAQHPNPSHFSY